MTTVPAFTAGTTDPVIVTSTKIDQNQRSTVALRVTDVAGNVTDCDPVLSMLKITRITGRATQTYRGLPQAESKVMFINTRPGVRSVWVYVNGKRYKQITLRPGARRTVSVARRMKRGNHNRITLIARGKRGASTQVVIYD